MEKRLFQIMPLFRDKIWGGTRLAETFGYQTPSDHTGEAWVVSSLAGNMDDEVAQTGMTLSQFYAQNRDLFGLDNEILPVKNTIIDAADDLSIQVHPNDEYARINDHSLGKPEAWFMLDVAPGAKLEFGHQAKDRKTLEQWVAKGSWDKLLRYEHPQVGDFLFVPDGTMHAIGKGLLVFEVSRNADLTYRLYDYDRQDAQGHKRPLDVKKSLDVLRVPFNVAGLTHPQPEKVGDLLITTYYDQPGQFTFKQLQCIDKAVYEQPEFAFLFVNSGSGAINDQPVKKGQMWLVPAQYGPLTISGQIQLLLTTYRK